MYNVSHFMYCSYYGMIRIKDKHLDRKSELHGTYAGVWCFRWGR